MEIRQLHAFVVLAESLSFREAAQKLFITQPALTKQIKALEQSLGAPLFTRGRHGAQLSSFGQQLYEKARELVVQAQEFKQFAQDSARQIKGNLAIGYGLSGIKLVPQLTAQFKKRYDSISIKLVDMTSSKQTEALLENQLQIGFLRQPVHSGLECRTLLTENLVLLVNPRFYPSTEINAQNYVQQLNKLPFIQIATGFCAGFSHLSHQIEKFLQANSLSPKVIQYVEDMQTMLALVSTGMGVGIFQGSAVHIAPADVDIIPLSGEHASWSMGMCWNAKFANPVRDIFINMVMEQQKSIVIANS